MSLPRAISVSSAYRRAGWLRAPLRLRPRRRAWQDAIFNTSPHIVLAALDGLGIAFLPEEEFAPHIEAGRLVRVLQDWCPPFSGYHLYYPSRRQHSPAFSLVVNALRM